MASVQPLTLQVSDLVDWWRAKQLRINHDFQRRSVWNAPAKSFLIDTILRGLPIPKIYIRSTVDPVTQKSIREVVDGQQRITAIVEFADGKLRLSNRAREFQGKKYNDLSDEAKQTFLGYIVSVDQLLNAPDDDVLEVFARLNSYTVTLSYAEKRHASFQTEFKWAVRDTATAWTKFFDQKKVLSLRERVRMKDDELVAEMYRILLHGVCDGGDPKLLALYKEQSDEVFTDAVATKLRRRIDETLNYFSRTLDSAIRGGLAEPYQILAMFAAYNHHVYGIPSGDIDEMPERKKLAEPEIIEEKLDELLVALESESPPKRFVRFVLQTRKTSPQRIAPRRIRFLEMVQTFGR